VEGPTRIALVQLPVPDPDPSASRANVPLAAGCLKAACGAARADGVDLPAAADIPVIPRALADHGGDAAVLAWLRSAAPDMVGFTASMWNVDRNLWLAERLRAQRPLTRVMLGGPEVVEGAGILASPHADSFTIGEGEDAFVRAAGDLAAGRSLARVYRGRAPLDLGLLPDPYLAGAVERRARDPLHLETTRGCPHRCSYCSYARSMPGVRSFPRERLARIFPWAREHAVPEIYLLDPSFTGARGWEERLRLIAALNTTAIPLHAEIRLESVTGERAALLAAAGIRSVEVGLQSTNPAALRAVRRAWQREAFVRGAGLLRRNGIGIRTGIILGLPEDTPDGFSATVDFLEAEGLAGGMEVHPLAVLPGTGLREEAAARGIRFLPWPPWEVTGTPTMTEDSIRAAMRDVEDRLGASLFPPVLPRFRADLGGFTAFLDLRGATGLPGEGIDRLANSLTVLVDAGQLDREGFIEELGRALLAATPHTLFQLVVAAETPLSPGAVERAAEALHVPGHYFNRANWLNDDPQARFSVRVFRLASASAARAALAAGPESEPSELVVRFGPRLLAGGGRLLRDRPLLLLEEDPGPRARAELAKIYEGCGELILEPDRRL
jgi:hypothetical protein